MDDAQTMNQAVISRYEDTLTIIEERWAHVDVKERTRIKRLVMNKVNCLKGREK